MSVAALARALRTLGDEAPPAACRALPPRDARPARRSSGPRRRHRLHGPRAGRVVGARGDGLRRRGVRAHVRRRRTRAAPASARRSRLARSAALLRLHPLERRPSCRSCRGFLLRQAVGRRARALRARDDVQRADGDVPWVGGSGGGRGAEDVSPAAAAARRRRRLHRSRARSQAWRSSGATTSGSRSMPLGPRWSTICATTSACCR